MKRLSIVVIFCFFSMSNILFAQGRRPAPPPPPRHYEIKSEMKREQLSKRLEQRRTELRRQDQFKDHRKAEPRERGRR